MISLLASVRGAAGGLDRVDHAVQLLEDEWRKQGDVPLERLWTDQKRLLESDTGGSLVMLTELVRADLRCRFARGQSPAVADYLGRFPELQTADSRVLSLIYEEFCLVEERGQTVDVDAFCQKYPRWKDSLVSQLQYHHLFSHAAGARPSAPPFPEPGDSFEEFQLISLLGRGGMSRVFLARDLSLGGKQVVLKVSLDRGREPQAQGALDDPHIVPVNSVVFSDDGMRGLSMPYRPGLPLDEIIRRVDPASRPGRAMALWEALVRAPDPPAEAAPGSPPVSPPESCAPGPRGDGWEGFPDRGTYAEGVAWIVKIVADALHYAHGQQTFHRDVKPANVLLTIQHGPQLLDFNLAESPHSASQAQAAMHGGTLPYMAPEQIEAFLDPQLWGKVGAQADVYSLGLVLRELLTGQAPDLPAETLAPARAMRVLLDRRPLLEVSVRKTNHTIPHALEAIVAKALCISTEERYPDAASLAEDLDRFLHRLPLVHAVNPSRRERSTNWAIRNRLRLVTLLAVAGPLVGWAGATIHLASRRPSGPIESSRELHVAWEEIDRKHVGNGIELFTRLSDAYPKSAIPKFYLSFAYDAQLDPRNAERLFSEALAMPKAREHLIGWSSKDPELTTRLGRFVMRRLFQGETIREHDDIDEHEREPLAKEPYRLARAAFEIAREVLKARGLKPTTEAFVAAPESSAARPDARFSDFGLAEIEQELGEYHAVLLRADRAIESARDDVTDSTRAGIAQAESVCKWRRLRARAMTKLAQRLRAQAPAGANDEALEKLRSVAEELTICANFATFCNNPLEMHATQRVRVDSLMTRVEIDLDMRHVRSARHQLKLAREALQRYEELSLRLARKPGLDYLHERFRAIDDRLRHEESRNNGSDLQTPEETATSGTSTHHRMNPSAFTTSSRLVDPRA